MVPLDALEGWISSLIGGAAAAVVGVLLLWMTQRHEAKIRERNAREVAARSLIVEISNLRDLATKGSRARSGDFALYGLRNQMALAEGPLGGSAFLEEVREFFTSVEVLRALLRAERLSDTRWDQLRPYREALDARAKWLVPLLHEAASEKAVVRSPKPPIPALPPRQSQPAG